ncbi:MAG: DUF86 domain-containing protein [Candidatus Symbiobacter sp.]|nr:DUF86 domain-containing protein [Candidatus Symbiobacter sp.]
MADKEKDIKRVKDIIENGLLCQKIAVGRRFDDLETDISFNYTLRHALQIIGEAANKISPETKLLRPEIGWRTLIDFRNVIVHDYYDIDPEIIWSSVTIDIPVIIGQFQALLFEIENT